MRPKPPSRAKRMYILMASGSGMLLLLSLLPRGLPAGKQDRQMPWPGRAQCEQLMEDRWAGAGGSIPLLTYMRAGSGQRRANWDLFRSSERGDNSTGLVISIGS